MTVSKTGKESKLLALVISLVLLCKLLTTSVKTRFPAFSKHFPEVGIVIMVGSIVGLATQLLQFDDELGNFDPAIFFVGLLPPIIFHSGLHLKRHLFFTNLQAILIFAIFGTFLSAGMISFCLHKLSEYGWFNESLSLTECWTFGSLISATDPVSSLALFADLRVEPNLFYLIFGESVFNDAVGIVLFQTSSKYMIGEYETFPKAFGDFCLAFFGSLLLGFTFAIIIAYLMKKSGLASNVVMEQSLAMLFIYLSYVVGEACELSGIVTTLVAGMATRKFIYPNLADESRKFTTEALRVLADLAETAAFIDLGLTLTTSLSDIHWRVILSAIMLCLISRPLQIYFLSFFLNSTPIPHKLDMKTQHMLSFAGIRGVVAFACANQWPDENKHKQLFMSTTSFVILFTIYVQGSLSLTVLRCLNIECNVDEDLVAPKPHIGVIKWWLRLVNHFIEPVVTANDHRNVYSVPAEPSTFCCFKHHFVEPRTSSLNRSASGDFTLETPIVTHDSSILETAYRRKLDDEDISGSAPPVSQPKEDFRSLYSFLN